MAKPCKIRQLSDHAAIDQVVVPIKGGTTLTEGALVVLEKGFAILGTSAKDLIAAGVAKARFENPGADGDVYAELRQGVFLLYNSKGTDEIKPLHVGTMSFIVDERTVALTDGAGGRSRAGYIMQLDPSGMVWVRVGLGLAA